MSLETPKPGTTLVIIVGASAWPKAPDLSPSEAFEKSATDLKNYFLDPERFGLPRDNLLDLFDSEMTSSDIDESICSFLDGQSEKLKQQGLSVYDVIVYYVGHGGFTGPNSDYFLAVRATRAANPLLSGILVSGLAKTLNEKMRSQRKYVVLDACFSASAYQLFQSPPMEVAHQKATEAFRRGTALLCSSGAREPSKLPPKEPYTMFTGALLEVLRSGSKQRRGQLSFRDVGELAKELIFEKYADEAVRPQVLTPSQQQGDIAELPLFPNPAQREDEGGEASQRPPPQAWFDRGEQCYANQDYAAVAEWFQKAAEQGHPKGQYRLGSMYQKGRVAPKRDDTKAVYWFQKAAEQGHPRSQYKLGFMYQEGHGVPPDPRKAAEWFQKAAEQGDKDAQYKLGQMYQVGEGVRRDDKMAKYWISKAAEQGHDWARIWLKNRG